MGAVDLAFDEMTEDVAATFAAPDVRGDYDVCVRGTDDMDNTGTAACTSLTVYDAYAKVSGTAGPPRGNSRSLAYSVDGWVATAGDEILGKVDVNYRVLGKTCRFTPAADSGLTIVGGVATLANWHSTCGPVDGRYELTLWDRDSVDPRGRIQVDDPAATYDIAGQHLATGNVHVVDLTPGTIRGLFSAPDSRYYSGLTPGAALYASGPIEFFWKDGVVHGGFWNEVVPPTAGTIYYNIAVGTTVVDDDVVLHFVRTVPDANDFALTGELDGTTLTGTAQGPYLFVATGLLIVS